MRSRAFAVGLLVAAIGLASCTNHGESGGRREVVGTSVMGIVVVDEAVELSNRIGDEQEWQAVVDSVVYERGAYTIDAEREVRHFPVPTVGELLRVYVDSGVALRAGDIVALRVAPPGDSDEWPEAFRWRAEVVLDSTGDGLAPGVLGDYEEILRDASLPGESLLDVLVAVATEGRDWAIEAESTAAEVGRSGSFASEADRRRAEVDAKASVPKGPRYEMMEAAFTERHTHDRPNEGDLFVAAAPVDRQLPFSTQFIQSWPPSVRAEVGADEWVQWKFLVQADEATFDGFDWVGVMFDDVGFIGPTLLAGDPIPLSGLGPVQGSLRLVLWEGDVPIRTIPPDAGGGRIEERTTGDEAFEVDAPEPGERVLVVIEDGQIADVSVLSHTEVNTQFGP